MSEYKGAKPARILITGMSHDTVSMVRRLAEGVEISVSDLDGLIRPPGVKERADALGVLLEVCEFNAACMNISVNEYLDIVESFREPTPLSSLAVLGDEALDIFNKERPFLVPLDQPERDDDLGLTDAQIRKQLKYEKNPMRIKQLNKALYRKKR